MPLRPVPWAIGNGAENSVELARASLFVGSNGNTGIIGKADFKVKALPTPGAAVRVTKGTGTIVSTYAGTFGQSYAVQEQSSTDVPVSATGSSGGATKYVYVLISDTQYGGQTPPSVENGPYNDYAVTTTLPTSQPYLLLAKINQPASTATIQNAHIEDLRTLANPGVWYDQRAYAMLSADSETLGVTAEVGEAFPNAAALYMRIPEFAVQMSVITTWAQVNYPGGNVYGEMWLEYGDFLGGSSWERSTQRSRFNSANPSDAQRANWIAADTVTIPKAMRGKTVRFVPKGKITATSSSAARPQMDGFAAVTVQAYFREVPEDD